MKTFTIENETNNITAHATAQEAESIAGAERFATADAWAGLTAGWPSARLVEIWNTLPGTTPVKKFKDRATAVSRIWARIQSLGEGVPVEATKKNFLEGSKTETILALIKRPDGASLKEIMEATNWQAHSVRGFISGTLGKKMRLTVVSTRTSDGQRIYSLKN